MTHRKRTTKRRNAKGHSRKMARSLAKWVRGQVGKKKNPVRYYVSGMGTRFWTTKAAAERVAKTLLREHVTGGPTSVDILRISKEGGRIAHVKTIRKNPVRRVSGSTGWVKGKAVRVVKTRKGTVVQVKR